MAFFFIYIFLLPEKKKKIKFNIFSQGLLVYMEWPNRPLGVNMIKNDWNMKLKIKTDIGVENILSSIWLDFKHHYSMSRPLSVLHQTSNTALQQLWYKRFINSVKCCVTTCHMSTADIYYWGTRVLPKQWVVQWAAGDPSVMWQIQDQS